MDEDSSDDSEDADSSDDSDAADSDAIINDADSSGDSDDESAASDEEEYAWGDHVSSRNAFAYNADDSSDSEIVSIEDILTEFLEPTVLLGVRRSHMTFLCPRINDFIKRLLPTDSNAMATSGLA